MKEFFIALVVLISYRASAQVVYGTTVILNFTEDKLVIAADSRGSEADGHGKPDDMQCKITQFKRQLVFTSSGAVRYASHITSVPSWDNTALVQEAVRSVALQDRGEIRLETISLHWAQSVRDKWKSIHKIAPQQVIQAAEIGQGAITVGFFAQAVAGTIEWSVVTLMFDISKSDPFVVASTKELAYCWPCGQPRGHRLCAGGKVGVATAFCSEIDSRKSTKKTIFTGLDAQESLAISVARMSVRRDKSGAVGGQIDAIALTRKGKIRWLRRKANCPQNQK